MARSLSAVLWLCVLSVLISGCGDTEPRNVQAGPDQHQSEIDCASEPAASSAVCRDRERQSRNLAYKDSEDDGDDPENAGCHLSFPDAMCTQASRNFSGDRCLRDGNTLLEYTNLDCHTALDVRRYDCDKYCRKKGFDGGGRCRQVRTEFCPPHGSAVCQCTNAT